MNLESHRKASINAFIKEYIDKYQGDFRITYVMLTKFINDVHQFKADKHTVANNINEENLNRLIVFNSTKKYKATHESQKGKKIAKIIENYLSQEHNFRILTKHIWEEVKKNGINILECSVYKNLTDEHKKFLKEHNKKYIKKRYSTYKPNPKGKSENVIEIFDNKVDFQKKIIELTLNERIEFVKRQGLIENLGLGSRYDKDKYAIIYFKTKF